MTTTFPTLPYLVTYSTKFDFWAQEKVLDGNLIFTQSVDMSLFQNRAVDNIVNIYRQITAGFSAYEDFSLTGCSNPISSEGSRAARVPFIFLLISWSRT